MSTTNLSFAKFAGIMASKRKRSCYDAAFKLKVVEFAEEYGNRAAEREYTI